jgi:tetratricopeptide (TPR) repeat protein
MRQDINYNEFIERYLQGEMSPEEKVWFEKEIEGNHQLHNEIDLHNRVNNVLADKELIDLKMKLEQIHQEIYEVTEDGKSEIRRIYRRVYYTSGVIVLVAVGLFLFMFTRNFSSSKLIDDYYSPTSASVDFRSAGEEKDQLTTAMKLYNNKEYVRAIALFEEILKHDSTKIGINLYSGISHMEIKEYTKANERFQQILYNQPNPFVESAKWYLGMCYLMTNNRDKAEEQFESLADSKGFYQSDARRILRRI